VGSLDLYGLAARALVLVDSAPIIYYLENHKQFAAFFSPLFEAHDRAQLRLAISSITIAEVLVGPLRVGNEGLVRRYRGLLESWQVVPLDADIAESAARLRASLGLKLADAVQAASALAINAAALVTHDRDFSRLTAMKVLQ
jgi:predicted nucleic acid-binding protein